jgi:hypothetical protein
MGKPWYKEFDPSTESFNKMPLWVRLLNLPLHLWLDYVLEAMGNAIEDFILVDSACSRVYRMMYARILVEMNISKGLPEMIMLNSLHGPWNQLLDYEGIPFRCRICHKTGHLASPCSSRKSRPKKPPSWWMGVTEDHYMVLKDSSIGNVDSSKDTLEVDSNVLHPCPAPVSSFWCQLLFLHHA